MKSLVISKSANNEVRLGWQCLPPVRKKGEDNFRVRRDTDYAEAVNLVLAEVIKTVHGSVVLDGSKGNYTLSHKDTEVLLAQQAHALDIISEVQQERKKQGDKEHKPGWGEFGRVTAFGKYARHTILEAGSVASRKYRKDGRGVEVTLTLPGGTSRAISELPRWTGYIVNRLLQVIRRRSPDCVWFYVWEHQQRGALHLHLALAGLCQSDLLQLGEAVRHKWFTVLDELSERTGIDFWLRAGGRGRNRHEDALKGNRVAEIEKDLSRYFAKYVSKGTKVKGGFNPAQSRPPSRWWGISRKLLTSVKEQRLNVRITGLLEDQLVSMLSRCDDFLRGYNAVSSYTYDFEVSYSTRGVPVHIGYGRREVSYYRDSDFDKLSVFLPQLLNSLVAECSDAVIEGDIGWLLHTTKERRSMQRKTPLAPMSA